jgi:outer membrane protein OmpA-like peptidoglycan-associated protein
MKTKSIAVSMTLIMMNVFLIISSCNWNRAQKGAAIGTAAGAGAGAAIGSKSNNTLVGALIGAAVGGTAGALIGNYMDKQAEELQRDLKNAKVERIGEGIKITFDSGLLFDIDSYLLTSSSRTNLNELATTLKKYDDTDILIEGHTDNTGTEDHNQKLSEMRASSVTKYLVEQGVKGNRITSNGYGEKQPVADNTSTAGREQNRRVDVAIMANKKLQRAAEKGELGQR